MTTFRNKFDHQVWAVVTAIPSGMVMGYGEVARAAGFPRYSRMVSKAMSRSPDPLPWHRVVRSNRTLAFEPGTADYQTQAQLLKQEGIIFEGVKIITTDAANALDRMLWGPID